MNMQQHHTFHTDESPIATEAQVINPFLLLFKRNKKKRKDKLNLKRIIENGERRLKPYLQGGGGGRGRQKRGSIM
jgi:hypothetical protein